MDLGIVTRAVRFIARRAAGLVGIFEVVAADKASGGRVKRRPICAGVRDCRPHHPLATLAARSTLAIPTCPKGQGTLRCASRVAGDTKQAKAEHGHCRRRAEFPALRDG